jgi:hypothetical protein
MSLASAIAAVQQPPPGASREVSKRYAEQVSYSLAREVANGLRRTGFEPVRPTADGKGEKAFQGGLKAKRIDVSHADERNGLLLAVSIKSIMTRSDFGKNLSNRFADMCTESINMHMRFPYAVIGGLFVFPQAADEDMTKGRKESTFKRATKLFSTITGRKEYTDAPEKFETFTMILFKEAVGRTPASVKLVDCATGTDVTEAAYYAKIREIFRKRNPHLMAEELDLDGSED